MKPFSVNKSSWHYHMNVSMAKTNDRLSRDDYAEKYVMSKDNLCSYWQMTLWSMFKLAVAAAFVIGVAGFLLFVIYKIGYAFLFHTAHAMVGTALITGAIGLAAGFAFAGTWLKTRRQRKLDNILYHGETETSLSKAKYSSWKSGICVPVEFKE